MANIGFRQTNFSIRSINEIIRLALKENNRSLCYVLAAFSLLLTPAPANAKTVSAEKPQIEKQNLIHASTHGDCISGDCINGQGTYFSKNGKKYIGEWLEGKRHGQGTHTGKGYKYVGEWRDNKRHGQGTETLAGGTKYVGEYRNNEFHGHGTLTGKGIKYIGEWRNSKQHGQGTSIFANGHKYVGEYRNGNMHGQGTVTSPDGFKYVGEYRDGKKYGQGTATIADGSKYIGEYQNDKRHGQGTFTAANGNQIAGEWRNGKKQGVGTFTLAKDVKQGLDMGLMKTILSWVLAFSLGTIIFIIGRTFLTPRHNSSRQNLSTKDTTKNSKRSDFAFWGGLAMCALLVIGAYNQLLKKNKQVRPNIVTEYTRHDGTPLTAEEVKEHLRIERISRKSEREARAQEPRYASRSSTNKRTTSVDSWRTRTPQDRVTFNRVISAMKQKDVGSSCFWVKRYSGPNSAALKKSLSGTCQQAGLSAY